MKKIFVLLLILFPLCGFSQTYKLYKTRNIHNQLKLNTATGAMTQIQDDGQQWEFVEAIEPTGSYTNRFQLFETQNMWTFIELDSFTGRLWQVQYSASSTDEMLSVPINLKYLDYSTDRSVFTIQPMTSMYQFYLIHEDTGLMWKFQWSTKGPDYRWIEEVK